MKTIDPVYILKLIDGSALLQEPQKQVMKDRLESLSETQIADLVMALEREHQALQAYYRQFAHIHKIAAEKKIKLFYDGAEMAIEAQEKAEIDNIESELAQF